MADLGATTRVSRYRSRLNQLIGGPNRKTVPENEDFPDPELTYFSKPPREFLVAAYNLLLRREPDEGGLDGFLNVLEQGHTRSEVLDTMLDSKEFWTRVPCANLLVSLHRSRCRFIQSLPRARRILDLGGTSQEDEEGAFVKMGYPYDFEELTIVDLPTSDRHDLYKQGKFQGAVGTDRGPVKYHVGSMVDLSDFADASFDLIYSGQSIEHVTVDDAVKSLAEAFRVLSPGGWLALDTPNGPACRLHQASFINDDHKYEYSHAELSKMLSVAGFDVVGSWGLNYLGPSAEDGRFSLGDTTRNVGIFHDVEQSYLLAYLARKPS